MMKDYNPFTTAALVIGLAVAASGGAFAAAESSHRDHGSIVEEMTLNDGQKWQTDHALRAGMTGIREEVSVALQRVHDGDLAAAEYAALAGNVEQHVDDIINDCKLPPEADMQLHIALTEILGGIDLMREGDERHRGVAAVVRALNAYGDHFDHPGWQPLRH